MDKESFLLGAIQDCQETIRFLDTKATLCTSVVGGYFVWITSNAENLLTNSHLFSWSFKITIWLFFIASAITIFCLKLIVFPKPENANKVSKGDSFVASSLWYLRPNNYEQWYNKLGLKIRGKLELTHSSLSSNIKSQENMIDQLVFENMKVNYVRNVKLDNFKPLKICILITSILFIAIVCHYYQYPENCTPEVYLEQGVSKSNSISN